MRPRVLFVSPHPEDARNVAQMLSSLPVLLEHAKDVKEARAKLRHKGTFGAVLTEAKLPDGVWQDVLGLARHASSDTEVVVTDRLADAKAWVEVLEGGGYDMLAQPFYAPEVQRILSNACGGGAEQTSGAAS